MLHPDGERIVARMDEGFVNGKGTITLEEREANARLIAAAPMLYYCLHNLVARGLIDTSNDYYDEAIEALNLATGQEP